MTKKYIICFIYILFYTYTSNAQTLELWGLTEMGGTHNGGTIFSLNTNQSKHTKEFEFYRTEAKDVGKSLVRASNGLVYGISTFGMGTIFQYNPSTNEYLSLYGFDYEVAYAPNYGLIEGSNGKLYGTTKNNGRYGNGVIFEFDISTNQLTVLYEFLLNSYHSNDGKLLEASNGKLYGLSSRGSGNGFIYEFNLNTNTYNELHHFNITNGFNPNGNLIEGKSGLLYGVTKGGGKDNKGILFEYNYLTNSFQVLNDFSNSPESISIPTTSPMFASDGNIYGVTGRLLYRYNPTQKKIDYFPSNLNTYNGVGIPAEGENKTLYFPVNSYNGGAIVSFNMINETYKIEKNFQNNSGDREPKFDFLFINSNYFLGISRSGWCYSDVLFGYDLTNHSYRNLVELNCGYEGAIPIGKLVQAANKKLYGYTEYGGINLRGSVFEFDPATKTRKTILHLADSNKTSVIGNLYQYTDNKIILITKSLGANNNGKMYLLDVSNKQLQLLFDYNKSTNHFSQVYAPDGSLTSASNGKIYGFSGNDKLTVTEIDPFTSKVVVKESNTWGNYYFNGGFIEADNGKFYGSTWAKGRSFYNSSFGAGTIIEYDLKQDKFTVKAEMFYSGIAHPKSNLIKSIVNNHIYGTFSSKGDNNTGGVFRYDYLTNSIIKIVEFDSTLYGEHPEGDIIQSPDGMIFGYCSKGGKYGDGTIFKFNPINSTITKLFDFNKADGNNPSSGGLTLAEICRPASKPTLNSSEIKYCTGDTIVIGISKLDTLNNAKKWSIYNNEGHFIQSNSTGVFKLQAKQSDNYHVRGEGGCPIVSPHSTVSVNVYPDLRIDNCDPELRSKADNASYSWIDYRDSSEVGIHNQFFSPSKNGIYGVILEQLGCKDTSEMAVVINAEILENSFQEALIFGPNPTSQFLTVNLRKCYEETTVEIRSLNGTYIKEESFFKKTKIQLLNDLPTNFYIVTIKTETGEKAILKILKM